MNSIWNGVMNMLKYISLGGVICFFGSMGLNTFVIAVVRTVRNGLRVTYDMTPQLSGLIVVELAVVFICFLIVRKSWNVFKNIGTMETKKV